MKKLLSLVFAAVLFSGCEMLQAGKSSDDKSPGTTESGKVKTGDTVVAKWTGGSFYEGKVEKIDGSKVTIAWLDKSNPISVDAVDVYSIPTAGQKPDVKAGDMVLAKIGNGTYWNGAEVTGVEGDVYKVRAVSSTTSVNIAAEKIIKVAAATSADFKDKAGATDFLKTAQNGRPTVPARYEPKKGDQVVAEWAKNSWYSGKIDNISGSNIYVAWNDGSKPSAVSRDKVIPMPTAANKENPKEDQYFLIKPESGAKWQYAQASIEGTDVQAKLPDGKTRTVKAGEFILLN